jgi:hypothetical protein
MVPVSVQHKTPLRRLGGQPPVHLPRRLDRVGLSFLQGGVQARREPRVPTAVHLAQQRVGLAELLRQTGHLVPGEHRFPGTPDAIEHRLDQLATSRHGLPLRS